jgi:hypothetical protein
MNINNEIKKLENMRTDLYQIISNISAMNEVCQAVQNDDRVYLWKGEFNDTLDGYDRIELYILAKTREEAETRLKAKADTYYDDYEYLVYKIEEDENGIIELD